MLDLALISALFAVVAPILFIPAVGFGWIKTGYEFHGDIAGRLVFYVSSPCLIFATLTQNPISLTALGQTVLATIVVIGCFMAIGYVILRATGLSISAYLPSLAFPNSGNMGLPLALFAFGETGLAFAIGFFVTCAIAQYSVGVAISSGTFRPKEVARNPLIWAALFGVAFPLTGTAAPIWLLNTTQTLGQIAVPLMLFTLGVSIARLKLTSIGRTGALSMLRLAMGLGLGLIVAQLFGFEGAQKGAFVVQAAMPAAVLNYLVAQQYNTAEQDVAAIVLTSTLLGFIALPAILLLAGMSY